VIRATDLSTIGVTLDHLRRQTVQFARAQEQVSSGRRVNRPSDDPAALHIGLRETRRIESLDARTKVLHHLRSTLSHTETSTREAHTILVRVREIAMSGRQSFEPAERQALAQELGTLRERLISIANSQNGGTALYGGTASDRLPFETAPDGTVTYVGSEEPMNASSELGDGAAVLPVGRDVFQTTTGTDVIDTFAVIAELRSTLENAGTQPATVTGQQFAQSLGDLDQLGDHLLQSIGTQSLALEQIESAHSRFSDMKLESETLRSQALSADLPQSIVALQQAQTQSQFTMASLSKLFDTSLLNFLA
jgi:flagellar hook-associated protein 3 FlgL